MKETKRYRHLRALFIALIFAVTMHPSKSQAQIIGKLEADIPFQFHVGNTELPPGQYNIHMLENSDLTIMEISSADGKKSAVFDVRDDDANAPPSENELIFNKYGNRYFLSELFDESNPHGSAVIESRDEKKVDKSAAEAQKHVPARHQGN
jgi:hypothetical protein